MVSMADDHVADYGDEGMRLTRRHVEAAGLVTAGTGEDLREAREARFLETHDGRVALVSTASTFPAHARAGPPRGGVKGRPGLSPLRVANQGPRPIEPAQLERLRATLRGMGVEVTPAGEPLSAFGVQLAAGDEASQPGAPNESDLREIVGVVENADALSDYVVVSVHAHNQGAYLQAFARAVIDAGADVMVGHGPHSLRGIEIYQGKPIFYSLGDFAFQDQTILRLPADSYQRYGLGPDATVADFNAARTEAETSDYESVVALPTFESGRLVSIELHPITLGGDDPASRGRPRLADPEQGQRIVQRLAEMSRRYGTVIEWQPDRGVGVVRVPSAS
jgi:poly-gamma-glutamate synthesis protein (capsule biosynthesis protein)